MAKKKYSYTYMWPTHQYDLGSTLKTLNTKLSNGWTSGIADFAVGAANKIINPGGNRSDVGDFLNSAADLVGYIPGIGTVVKYGIKGLTALGNAAFGSNVNPEDIDRVNAQTSALGIEGAQAGNWDVLANTANAASGLDTTIGGSQGWFNHDLDKAQKRADWRRQNMLANVQLGADNISTRELKFNRNNVMANGGPIFGTDYDINLSFINNGGTHEENPYGGVFYGVAPDGQPNQVEEGEIVFNDYVYSNRIPVPKAVRSKYKMRDDGKLSFADVMENYIRKNGIDERENDPIAMRGFESFAMDMAQEQEAVKAKKELGKAKNAFAEGGRLFPWGGSVGDYTGDYSNAWSTYVMPGVEEYFNNALSRYNAATTAADKAKIAAEVMNQVNGLQSGYQGISGSKMGTRSDAIKAHQAAFNAAGGNRGFAGGENVPGIDELIKRGYTGGTQDNASGNFDPDGIYGWRTNIRHFGSNSPEDAAAMERIGDIAKQMGMTWSPTLSYGDNGQMLYTLGVNRDTSGLLPKLDEVGKKPNTGLIQKVPAAKDTTTAPSTSEEGEYDATYWLDKLANNNAGLMANIAGLAYNMFDPYKPEKANVIGPYSPIRGSFLGDYMRYNPMDINFASNQQASQNAATRNTLMQSASPSRNAALLAADYSGNLQQGNLYRQGLEYNDQLRRAVADFNRGTNQFNVQMALDASARNQAARQAYYESLLDQSAFNISNSIKHKMAKDQAIGQGITSVADYIRDMEKEDIQGSWVNALADSGVFGALNKPMTSIRPSSRKGSSKSKPSKKK